MVHQQAWIFFCGGGIFTDGAAGCDHFSLHKTLVRKVISAAESIEILLKDLSEFTGRKGQKMAEQPKGIGKITLKDYDNMVQAHMPESKLLPDCLKAFWVGGTICAIGECIRQAALKYITQDPADAGMITSVTLVVIAVLLTIFGVYEKIGRYAGAGSIVPITGFANSIASPAIESRQEGYITGTGVKMFEVAGPVLVFGISASVVAGIIIYVCRCFGWA